MSTLDRTDVASRLMLVRNDIALIDVAIAGLDPFDTHNHAVDGMRCLCERMMDELNGVINTVAPQAAS